MGNSLYAVKETGICPACGFLRDSPSHFRTHIPRNKWPESMGKRKERVVVNGLVYDADKVPGALVGMPEPGELSPEVAANLDHAVAALAPSMFRCDECGRTSPSKAGLVAHQRTHKAVPA